MAVRADELALGYLIEDLATRPALQAGADVPKLGDAGQVIPLQDLRRKDLSAIGARSADLQAQQPLSAASLPSASRHVRPAQPLIPLVVDDGAAGLAVNLHPIAAVLVSMELGERLRLSAACAALQSAIAHSFDINIDIDRRLRASVRTRRVTSPCH